MSVKVHASDESAMQRTVRAAGIGVIAGILVLTLVMLALSVFVTVRDVPQAIIDPMAIFAASVGAFAAGIICTKITRTGGLVHGALCGAIITLLVLIIGIAAGYGGLGVPAMFKTVFIMLSAMLGGVTGVNARKRGRR